MKGICGIFISSILVFIDWMNPLPEFGFGVFHILVSCICSRPPLYLEYMADGMNIKSHSEHQSLMRP